ncbi:hypothetical protein HPB47_020092 [Ixodes persulcatus]|uniref:Uncharacterized protein n=1 Tax=Ixodes persulcatus TaxID=34615 RepID=A0AC60QJU0_IXOPE|nr:hypothetical protein HPB47_020092 [Ixodes persulcatus]
MTPGPNPQRSPRNGFASNYRQRRPPGDIRAPPNRSPRGRRPTGSHFRPALSFRGRARTQDTTWGQRFAAPVGDFGDGFDFPDGVNDLAGDSVALIQRPRYSFRPRSDRKGNGGHALFARLDHGQRLREHCRDVATAAEWHDVNQTVTSREFPDN